MYKEYIDYKYIKDTYNEVYYIYKVLDKLHEELNKDLSLDELIAAFYAAYPDSNKESYNPLFDAIAKADISLEAGDNILQQIKQRKLLLKLSETAYAATQGRATADELTGLFETYVRGTETSIEDAHEEFVSDDLEWLIHSAVQKPGLRWRLNCLNKSLGSLRKGDFGFIFARPETGKTTFLASEVSCMLQQTDKDVIWFNNEEQGEKVMLRVYQAFFGVNLHTLVGNAKRYKAEWAERVGTRFKLVDDAGISKSNVEKVLQRCNPGLIIYDQIDKIKGFKADRDDLVYGEIYQWGRELAKAYAPSIGVCQAGGTAEGQKYLTMDHVANAKTSKQAEADFILGIGKTHEESTEYIRFLNISKNKLLGDEDSLANLKHGRFEVLIQPEVARYKDIVDYN
jgi:hypothetical protein